MKNLKIGKKSGLKYFSIADIRSWSPCYDPSLRLPETWRGTAVTILKNAAIPHEDRLWVVLRPEIISERAMRLFAVGCARQVQHLMKDERSLRALDVAEAYANGNATKEELDAARVAAWDAARDAAWVATSDTAWVAALGTALTTARAAQRAKLIEMIVAEGLERKQEKKR